MTKQDLLNIIQEEVAFVLEKKKKRKKKKKSFPDLTGDGKVTRADILKGRGVKLDEEELEEKNSKCTKTTKKASSTRKGKKWMKCGYKRIHWGQKGVRVTGKSGNTKRKKSFKSRHNCAKAKSNTPQGQACKDWAEE